MNIERLTEFLRYTEKEILPATADIENLDDRNRKHVQKLVYTNLVDRFDSMIDGLILQNCRSDFLVDEAAKNMNQQITEAEFLKLLMRTGDIQDAIDEKLHAALRNSILRERHSKKLAKLLDTFGVNGNHQNFPRVNRTKGTIHDAVKPSGKSIPVSLCGFADWLYSRRNAIVHGSGGNRVLLNDLTQLTKLYKCAPAKTFRIKLGTVTVAAEFYKGIANILIAADEA